MKHTDQRPIVCGTDFSTQAMEAANVASAMATRLCAPLLLVHGVDQRGDGDDVAETICRIAQRFDADLICIGSHRSEKGPATAPGGIAHSVIARSHCPVLVVPQPLS